MARPREFDMDVAIAQIGDVFWDGGFEATSITDLEDATGLARARLYAAFGTKRDMLHRSIDNYLDGPLEMVIRRRGGGDENHRGGLRGGAGRTADGPRRRHFQPELLPRGDPSALHRLR